jgi:hypothetical protein
MYCKVNSTWPNRYPLGYWDIGIFYSIDIQAVAGKSTGLDASKNTKLTVLYCTYNQFDAARLNALFNTLHSNYVASGKTINIQNNPGTAGCTLSYATGRG